MNGGVKGIPNSKCFILFNTLTQIKPPVLPDQNRKPLLS